MGVLYTKFNYHSFSHYNLLLKISFTWKYYSDHGAYLTRIFCRFDIEEDVDTQINFAPDDHTQIPINIIPSPPLKEEPKNCKYKLRLIYSLLFRNCKQDKLFFVYIWLKVCWFKID